MPAALQTALLGAAAVLGVPLAVVGYSGLVELLLRGAGSRASSAIRPWLWVAPAFAFLFVFLVYPALNTIIISFRSANASRWVGLANYLYVFTDRTMLTALANNLLWLVFGTLIVVTIGLLIAVLTDRVSYEKAAKSLIFLPMAISAVAAGVIWKLMYEYKPAGTPQIGTLNAALAAAVPGFQPQAWLFNPPWNNFALIAVFVWMWTGFCMVILSAAIKGIPAAVLEAARIDGAGEWRIFWRVMVPMMRSTLIVVATTMVINVLKVFDVVYTMTNGALGTEVIANRMYKEMFNFQNSGRAGAIAVVLLLATVPVMIANIRRFGQKRS